MCAPSGRNRGEFSLAGPAMNICGAADPLDATVQMSWLRLPETSDVVVRV